MTKGSCFCNCEQAKKRLDKAKRFFDQDFSLDNDLGSGPANRAFEASEWRTYRAEMRVAKTGRLCQRISVRDGSHYDVLRI